MTTVIYNPEGCRRLGDVLVQNLLSRKWLVFRAAVAFVKQSGTKHLAEPLRTFLGHGSAKISVGIDHRGTSVEGLTELLSALGERGEGFVFHNRSLSTFHPKLYLFANERGAECLIGSGNLTEGGLFTNYEVFVGLSLDKNEANDRKILASIERLLDCWSDATRGTVQRLSLDLISILREAGDLLTEEEIRKTEKRTESVFGARSGASRGRKLFQSVAVNPAPRVTGKVRRKTHRPGPAKRGRGQGAPVFVMTLQQTDVGVGQKTMGASKRSPEIFIPMNAVREDPGFWGWPDLFVPDPKWAKKKDRDGHGKMDRPSVKMLLGGAVLGVNWWYNPEKIDIRLRNAALRDAGNVGDIIRIDKVDPGLGYEYVVRIISASDPDFAFHLGQCLEHVKPPSMKRYGYFRAS